MGKQPMMDGHSSAMLSRIMDCYVFYRSIPPGYTYCTFLCISSVPSIGRTTEIPTLIS